MTLLELAHQIGIRPKWVASTAGGEFHSSCPQCGGTDRFYIQPYRQMYNCIGSYCCRRCGIYGNAIQFARQFLNLSFQEAATTVNAVIKETPWYDFKQLYEPQASTIKNLPTLWQEQATAFIEQAHTLLLHQPDVLDFLAHRGLPLEAVQKYKFAWSDNNEFLLRSSWGLDEQCADGKPRKLWIPKGLVIPTRQADGKVVRMKVRRFDWKDNDKLPKYIAISGSMNGLNIIGDRKLPCMIIVESELDAYAIDYTAHDHMCAVAVGSNIKNPDNITDYYAKKASHLLICHDNDPAGIQMLKKWKHLYPHARAFPTPIGKDIGEAIQQGLNIREWLRQERMEAQK